MPMISQLISTIVTLMIDMGRQDRDTSIHTIVPPIVQNKRNQRSIPETPQSTLGIPFDPKILPTMPKSILDSEHKTVEPR